MPTEAETAAATAATTAAAAAAAAAPKPWYEGRPEVTPEVLGHWQNRGWATKTPEEIAIAGTLAHREAEKYIGAPANELVRLLKPGASEADIKAFYSKLGVPPEAKDYDFSKIKRPDGKPIDDALAATIREGAFNGHLTKEAAETVAARVQKHLDDQSMEAAAVAAAALKTERDALMANWGTNKEANLLVAKNTAAALGVKPETVALLEKQVGYSAVMEMFRAIGQKIGEDKFIGGGPHSPSGVMTVNQAKSRKAELMTDNAWAGRFMNGGAPEAREMTALNTIIVGAKVSQAA